MTLLLRKLKKGGIVKTMRGQRRVIVRKQPEPNPDQPPPQRVDGSMNHLRIFIYPSYIDSNMTIYRGRKLPVEECVENPWIEEISRAIADLGFEGLFTVQKRHPRNYWKFGRASVNFYKIDEATGERVLLYPQYPKRKDIYRVIAAKIKEHRKSLPQNELKKRLTIPNTGMKKPGQDKPVQRKPVQLPKPKK